MSSLSSKVDVVLSAEIEDPGGEAVLGMGLNQEAVVKKQKQKPTNSSILLKVSLKLETSKWKYAIGSWM